MNYQWHDFLGNFGVLLIVSSYLLMQLDRLGSQSFFYLLANAVGACLVLVSLFGEFNLSAFIIEIFWLLISVFGLVKNRRNFFIKSKKA